MRFRHGSWFVAGLGILAVAVVVFGCSSLSGRNGRGTLPARPGAATESGSPDRGERLLEPMLLVSSRARGGDSVAPGGRRSVEADSRGFSIRADGDVYVVRLRAGADPPTLADFVEACAEVTGKSFGYIPPLEALPDARIAIQSTKRIPKEALLSYLQAHLIRHGLACVVVGRVVLIHELVAEEKRRNGKRCPGPKRVPLPDADAEWAWDVLCDAH